MDTRFSKAELSLLLQKATLHYTCGQKVLCKYLYRNKPLKYFNNIYKQFPNIMETYVKDNSGDPRSPINGKLFGLFFMASVQGGSTTGQPKKYSQFGRIRLTVPVEVLFDVWNCNLYFTDFFCMRGKEHFVTLILTKKNSEADRFCKKRVLKLDAFKNPFFFFDEVKNSFIVSNRRQFTVEVFYTEDIDLQEVLQKGGILSEVKTIGKGSSTKRGIPKNPNCTFCNLSNNNEYINNNIVRQNHHINCQNNSRIINNVITNNNFNRNDVFERYVFDNLSLSFHKQLTINHMPDLKKYGNVDLLC